MREVVEHDHWEPMAELVQQGVEMLFELSPAKLTVGFARRMRNGSTPYRDRAVGTRELRQEVADIWQSAAEAIVAAKGDEAEQALFRAVDQFVRSANEGDGAERPAPTGRTA
jgi:hypothetical protein